jgi:hypothetical protein
MITIAAGLGEISANVLEMVNPQENFPYFFFHLSLSLSLLLSVLIFVFVSSHDKLISKEKRFEMTDTRISTSECLT